MDLHVTESNTTIRRAYLDLPDGQLHYYRTTAPGLPLLLLHQVPSSGATWASIMGRLVSAGFDPIALDLPGFGASFHPKKPPKIDEYARWVVEALAALNLNCVDVVGHHTGASIALKLAQLEPGLVNRLVLWSVPLLEPALRDRLAKETPPDYDDDGKLIAAEWSRRRRISGTAYSKKLGIRAHLELLQTGENRPWGHWAVAALDHEELLRAVPHRTLVMSGRFDPVWALAHRASELMRDAEFLEIAGAGMDVVDEFPEAFCDAVEGFLSRSQSKP